ncbi:hypothetical protein RND71_028536 [Anisodus tanguticus]|uniref:Uncharacterized protein n=1 Tax=Anisodus tanguticus TaxID=243964 RepID=A0AAE1V1Q0_9SOLA|nr:hypothetical protein RND71_028536 [Anisodus tanguticus]
MGNIFSFPFRKQSICSSSSSDNCTSTSRRTRNQSLSSFSSFESSIISDHFNEKRSSTETTDKMMQNKKSKYDYIPDNFSSLDQHLSAQVADMEGTLR